MSKVVKETWTAEPDGSAGHVIEPGNDGLHPWFERYEAAQLVACAPEMARLLLASEWSGSLLNSYGEESASACPWCWGAKELTNAVQDQAGIHLGHNASCPFDAVLRKAGLR